MNSYFFKAISKAHFAMTRLWDYARENQLVDRVPLACQGIPAIFAESPALVRRVFDGQAKLHSHGPRGQGFAGGLSKSTARAAPRLRVRH